MAIVLQDDFSEADATNLSGKALDVGGNWTVHTGTGDVNGARGRQTSATYTDLVMSVDGGEADGDLSVVINVASDSFDLAGGLIRVTDGDDYWLVGYSPTRDTLYIYEKVSGSFTERATQALTGSPATDYTLLIEVSGTSVTGTIGATSVNYPSMATGGSATRWGLWSNIQGTKFDDFSVTADTGEGLAIPIAMYHYRHHIGA